MIEHRIRSIPPRTTLDAIREQESGTGRLTPREPGQGSSEQSSGGFDVKRHVFQKPPLTKPVEFRPSQGTKEITWEVETVEDYNNRGDLCFILQFSGISFINPVFVESKHDYGPDGIVSYTPVSYKKGRAFLIFSTFGDIFESQVVPKTKDINPFFREEIYWPELLTHYIPTSMKLSYNNGLLIVEYKARNLANI